MSSSGDSMECTVQCHGKSAEQEMSVICLTGMIIKFRVFWQGTNLGDSLMCQFSIQVLQISHVYGNLCTIF